MEGMLEILEFVKKLEKLLGSESKPFRIADDKGGVEIKLEKLYIRPPGKNQNHSTKPAEDEWEVSRTRDLSVKSIGSGSIHQSGVQVSSTKPFFEQQRSDTSFDLRAGNSAKNKKKKVEEEESNYLLPGGGIGGQKSEIDRDNLGEPVSSAARNAVNDSTGENKQELMEQSVAAMGDQSSGYVRKSKKSWWPFRRRKKKKKKKKKKRRKKKRRKWWMPWRRRKLYQPEDSR